MLIELDDTLLIPEQHIHRIERDIATGTITTHYYCVQESHHRQHTRTDPDGDHWNRLCGYEPDDPEDVTFIPDTGEFDVI